MAEIPEQISSDLIRQRLQENLRRGWPTERVVIARRLLPDPIEEACLNDGQIIVNGIPYPVEVRDEVLHHSVPYGFLTLDSTGKPIIY